MGRVEGKMAFVTGGAQGLGRASALLMAKEGAKVTVADINEAGAKKVAEEINAAYPGKGFAAALDVTSESQWQSALDEAVSAMGGLNVLVNNAGIGGGTTVEDTDFATWKKVQEVDSDSVFLGCKYAIRHMVPHAPGSIINVSSIAGLIADRDRRRHDGGRHGFRHLEKSAGSR